MTSPRRASLRLHHDHRRRRIVANDTPRPGRLGGGAAGAHGDLWDVFMAYTGRSLDDDIAEDGEEAVS